MANVPTSSIPPLPGDAEESARRDEARRRRRLMEGNWRQDAVSRITQFFHATTAERLGHVDLTRNAHRQRAREIAVRYQDAPERLHPDEAADSEMREHVSRSGLWSVAARNERFVVSHNTSFIRTDWAAPGTEDEGLCHTVVTPDLVYVECDPERPRMPVYAIHARIRTLPGEENAEWFWDEFDIREAPTFRILKPRLNEARVDRAEDVTSAFVDGDLSGAGYHWTAAGRPIVPLVPYISDPGAPGLFDWREGCEVVDATLIGAALWSMWAYSVRDGAHPIRALADGSFLGGSERKGVGRNARETIINDPTTMQMVRSEGSAVAHALEWGPAVDPERLQLAIDAYMMGAMQSVGLSPDDFQRSGQAESGYALALKGEAKRREQRRMAPAFAQADAQTLALSAALLNRYKNAGLPEDGWELSYSGIPLTPAEKQERREEVISRLEMGTASLVDAVMAQHPNWSREEATAHLEQVQQERARFRSPNANTV